MQDRTIVVGAMLAMAVAAPAHGQEARRVSIQPQIEITHDTNVAAASKAEALRQGLKPEDTFWTPGVGLDIVAPVGRQSVFLKGFAGYSQYDANDRLNSERIDLTGGVNARFGPCAPTLDGKFQRARTNLQDLTTASLLGNINETKRAEVSVTCGRPTGIGVTVGGAAFWSDNTLTKLAVSNNHGHEGSARISYSRPALGTLSLFGSGTQIHYDANPLFPGIQLGYNLVQGGLEFNRQLGARIQGDVGVSYTSVRSLARSLGQFQDFQGFTYSADLSYRPTSRLKGAVHAERGVSPSQFAAGGFQVKTLYNLDLNYKLGTRLTLDLNGGEDSEKLKGSPTLALGLTDSRVDLVQAGIRYQFSQRISLGMDVRHTERRTNDPKFDYTSDRVSVMTTVAL